MEDFLSLSLPEKLILKLKEMNFLSPTPIQQQAIPVAIAGRDILGSAQTGTGKTGAFGIPLVSHLILSPRSTALILTPTRELATQVISQLHLMIDKSLGIRSALLIGGDSMERQLQQIRQRPRLFVGTPGRVNDHLQRGSLKLHDSDFLVLDETDRMLDMGFSIQIDDILRFMTRSRQTLLFSATMPAGIQAVAQRYLKDPVHITIDSPSQPVNKIEQSVLHVKEENKYTSLVDELEKRTGSIIIFVKTKFGTEKLAIRLDKEGHSATAIHGDLRQRKRDKVIADFRKQKYRILVATDIAARGLDIPHIEHVINYDLPMCPEDYIHRIGRTARAGAEGSALCFISPADKKRWIAIDRMMNPQNYQGNAASSGEKRGSFGFSGRGFGSKPSRNSSSSFESRRSDSSRNSRFEGESKPRDFSRFEGESKPRNFSRRSRFEGESKPRDFSRDSSRFEGESKPRDFSRDSSRFEGESKPRDFSRDSSRFEGESKPRNFSRSSRFEGESKPRDFSRDSSSRFEGESKPRDFSRGSRFEGESKSRNFSRGSRFEGESKPRDFSRDSSRFEGESKPRDFSRGSRFDGVPVPANKDLSYKKKNHASSSFQKKFQPG